MPYGDEAPKLGATFTPGGFDDFYIPNEPTDVVSPTPHRPMAELEDQISSSLGTLELDSRSPPQVHQISNPPIAPLRQADQRTAGAAAQQNYQQAAPTPISALQSPAVYDLGIQGLKPNRPSSNVVDEPNFSPFPKLKDRTPNVPPSDAERETTLEGARVAVLGSTDPEMQLMWAQDALRYVEICTEDAQRQAKISGVSRPSTPQIEHQLRVDSTNIVGFLSEQEHPRANFIRGMWLEFGRFGFREDKKEAFRCYRRAASKGLARAEYRMGMQFESTNEQMNALQHYKVGEAAGDSASCYRLGMMSLLGQLGQPQDFVAALRLIKHSADTADENGPQGAYVYGMLLARELPQIKVPEVFLPLDLDGAKMYVEKAAYLGFSKAQLKMGEAYELCSMKCDFDPTLSLHYNALAARQGEPEAMMAISKWFLCGYEGVFYKNEQFAFLYAEQAAASGLAMAKFAMGYFYEIGMHVPRDLNKALEWYQRAAADGNADAKGRIAGIESSSPLSKDDHEQVAVSRIKSQHGSRRGGRPERFAAKPMQTMPTVADEGFGNGAQRQQTPRAPGQDLRQGTTTPYPVNDLPGAALPYPMADNLPNAQHRPPPAGGFLNVDPRASSSANGRPSNTPAYAGYSQGQRPASGPMPPVGRGGPPARPYSNAPGPTEGPRRPVSSQQSPASMPMRQDYRLSSEQAPPPAEKARPLSSAFPHFPSRQDLGPLAPSKEARVDPRTRPQAPQGPLPSGPGVGRPLAQRTESPHMSPKINPMQPQNNRPHSRQPSAGYQTPSIGAGPSAPPPPGAGGRPGQPQQGRPAAAARPPTKGPRTFEEMGVPATKKDQDCVSQPEADLFAPSLTHNLGCNVIHVVEKFGVVKILLHIMCIAGYCQPGRLIWVH